MADGSVIIDTKLDQSGLKTGLSQLGSTLAKGIAVAVEAAGAALVGLGTYATKVGSDFEYAVSGVAATMGKTVDDITVVADKAKELGASTKFTATEAAEGFNILAMAGLSLEEQLAAIDATLSLASAGEMSMDSAAGYLTTTVKAMSTSFREAGISMDDCTKIANMYAKGATLANTSTSDLGEAVSTAASIGGAYNQSLNTTTAALLTLAEKGYQGSQAGTYLGRAMADLYAPTDNAASALEELGVSAYDAQGNQRDFLAIINDLNFAFKGLTEEEKANYTSTIFTTIGLKAYNSISGNTVQQIHDLETALSSAWYTEESLANSLATYGVPSLAEMKNNLAELGVTADDFSRSLAWSGGNVDDFLQALEENTTAYTDYQDIINAIGGDTAKLGLAFSKTTGAAQAMADTKLDNLQGDITILGSATEGFGIAFYEAMSGIGEGTGMMRDFVQEATDIMSDLTTVVNEKGFDGLVDELGNALSRAVNKIVEYVPMLIEGGITLVSSLVKGLSESADTISTAATSLVSVLLKGIISINTDLLVLGAELVISLCNGLSQNIGQIADTLISGIVNFVGSVTEYIPQLAQAGVILVEALVQGVLEALPKLIEAVPTIISDLLAAIESSLPILLDCVVNLVLAIANALPSLISTLVTAVTDSINLIIDAVIEMLPILVEAVTQVIVAVAEALPDILQTIIDVLPSLIENIVSAMYATYPMLLDCILQIVLVIVQELPQMIRSIVAILPSLIGAIITGLVACIPSLISCVTEMVLSIVKYLPEIIINIISIIPALINSIVIAIIDCIPILIGCVLDLVIAIAEAMPDIIMTIVQILPTLIESIIAGMIDLVPLLITCVSDMIVAIVKELPQLFTIVVEKMTELVKRLAQNQKDLWVEFKEAAKEWINRIWEGIEELWDTLVTNVSSFFEELPNIITEAIGDIAEVGRNLVKGLWNGIKDTTQWVLDKIKGFGSSILDGIKNIFGIASPSKVFRDVVGKNLALGLANGITDNAKFAVDAAKELAEDVNNVDFDFGNLSAPDYNDLATKMQNVVTAEKIDSGIAISSAKSNNSYSMPKSNDDIDSDNFKNGTPQYVENNIFIDGKKTARVITPYVSKELDWEGK